MGYLVETSGRILLPESLERQALTVLEVRMAARQGWFDEDEVAVDSLEEMAPFAAAHMTREGDWLVLDTDEDGDPKWSEQASEFYRTLGSFVREGEVRLTGEDGQSWSYLYSGDGVVQQGANGWDGTPGDALPTPVASPAVPSAPSAPSATEPPESLAPPESPGPSDQPPSGPPPGGEAPDAVDPSQFHYPGREDRPATPRAAPSPTPPPGPAEPSRRAEGAWADPPPASTGRTVLMALLLVVGVVLIIGIALLVSGL